MARRSRIAAISAGMLCAALLGAPGIGQTVAQSLSLASDPAVSFVVRNTNTSKVPCPSDGKTYIARGHLVAPAGSLDGPGPFAITLYVHGLALGEFFWNFAAVPAYDYATEMANLGHISVVIDRLGYDSSGKPQGTQICAGSEASIIHQIIKQLRKGSYGTSGPPATAFDTVALAGHSYGGLLAQVEAYSYSDIDALIVMGYSDTGATLFALNTIAGTRLVCASGGQRSEGTSGPGGYAYFGQTPQDFKRAMFFNAEASVVAAATPLRNRDPCGDTAAAQAILLNLILIPTIKAPVLLVYGDHDALFSPDGGVRQRLLYAGSSDVTYLALAGTGHAMTLGRTAPALRSLVSDWLTARGF